MPSVTEPLLIHWLWDSLEQEGYEVAGEVATGNGPIDLAAKTPDGEYIGYEVKDQRALEREIGPGLKPERARQVMKQLNRYRDSGSLDRLYYCSQEPEDVHEHLTQGNPLIDMQALNQESERTIPTRDDLQTHAITIPRDVGVIKVPIDFAGEESLEELKQADRLHRTNTPTLPRDNEAWVNHRIWKHSELLCDHETYWPIGEGVLPNLRGSSELYLDVMIFDGDPDPTEILKTQNRYSLIGIEGKGSRIDSVAPEQIRSKLNLYAKSGALTQLYLAVPHAKVTAAKEVLGMVEQSTFHQFTPTKDGEEHDESEEQLQEVGLITVSTEGDIDVVRTAGQLEMRYDGLRTRDTPEGSCKVVGWDTFVELRDSDEFEAVFDQEDLIHRKARKIDLAKDQWQAPLGRAKQKVQSGGEPTDRERSLIQREYERQFGED